MAVGRKCEALGLVPVRSHPFRRKRVVFSSAMEVGFISTTPAKKHNGEVVLPASEKSPLEALPQDILIRIVCGVEHDDLRALFHVSKTIQEATVIAKKLHFEYSTPKKTVGFQNKIVLDDFGEFNEVEAPNAPRQIRVPKSRLINKKLADISVALFTSDDDEKWPRKQVRLQMKTPI